MIFLIKISSHSLYIKYIHTFYVLNNKYVAKATTGSLCFGTKFFKILGVDSYFSFSHRVANFLKYMSVQDFGFLVSARQQKSFLKIFLDQGSQIT